MSKSDIVAVPALSAGYAYVGSKFLLQNQGQVSIGGMSLDKNLAVAAWVGIGALAAQASKDYIIPRIPTAGMSPSTKKAAEAAVGPVVCGAVTWGVEKMVATPDTSVASLISGTANQSSGLANAALGAGAYVAADYTYNTMLK